MRAKEFAELKRKSDDDLRKALEDKRRDLVDVRFQHATGALENPARLGELKRDIARIHTVLNERTAVAAAAPAEQ